MRERALRVRMREGGERRKKKKCRCEREALG